MLHALKVNNFRNLQRVEVELASGFNFFYGDNGSGKTSLLEAIYFLTHGRSFRTHSANRIINSEAAGFTLFGTFLDEGGQSVSQAGLERTRQGDMRIRINGSDNCSIVDLVSLQPLLLLNPFTFQLLDAGPQYRRQYLDWGVFHVERHFIMLWRRVQRALKQRNAALKIKDKKSQARIWDTELISASLQLHELRKFYVEQLTPVFLKLIGELSSYQNISISYLPGWDEATGLAEAFDRAYERDCLLGYTQYGPQKADIVIKCNNVPVVEQFSRGEQKLLVYALRLAQGILLKEKSNKNSIYLVDDLAAELDEANQEKIFAVLKQLDAQVLVTSVHKQHQFTGTKSFQIKQGSFITD